MAIVDGQDMMVKYSQRLHIHQGILLGMRSSVLLVSAVLGGYNILRPCDCFFPSFAYLRSVEGVCDRTKSLQWYEAILFGGLTAIHTFFGGSLITWINVFTITIFEVYNWYLDLAKQVSTL